MVSVKKQEPITDQWQPVTGHRSLISFLLKKLLVLCGGDIVKLIQGHVNVGDIFFSTIEKMGENHAVCSPVSDDHDVSGGPT